MGVLVAKPGAEFADHSLMGLLGLGSLAWVGLVRAGKTGTGQVGGCGDVAWIMTNRQGDRAGEGESMRMAGNVRGSVALCLEPVPALGARAFHSLPPFPASVTE